jgi:hypothetical protein
MTSGTLRNILIVGAAIAAVSVAACKKNEANTAENTAAASDANAAMAASSASNTAMAANAASNDASATAPMSSNATNNP